MPASCLAWREPFAAHEAAPHESGLRLAGHRALAANASYSLKTTAADYGAFLAAVLAGAWLKHDAWRRWLSPAVMLPRGALIHLNGAPLVHEPDIGWGLG